MTNRSGSKRPLINAAAAFLAGSQGDDPVERRDEVGQQGRPSGTVGSRGGRHNARRVRPASERLGMARRPVPALGAIQIVSRFTNPSLAAMGEPRDRRPGAGSES